MAHLSTHHNLSIDDVNVSYTTAGSPQRPALLLLHGYPSSNNQYRNLIPLLSQDYYVIAPSLPGYGLSTAPASFVYTFDSITEIVSSFLTALKVTKYVVYTFDYGAPVAWRLALQNPKSIQAIISQNGNAYAEGLGHPFWTPIEALWKSNSDADREFLRENAFTFEAVKSQYVEGTLEQDLPLIDPATYTLDYLQNIQGRANQDRQLALFYDYRTNVTMYPALQKFFKESQVPLLAVWGKNDSVFIAPGAEAFKRDLPNAEVRFVDAGHFALETKLVEISTIVLAFLKKIGY